MYKRLVKMSDVQVQTLISLKTEVNMSSAIEHYGVNGFENISVYTVSKWYNWNRLQKKLFKECFNQEYISKALIGWFLHFPETTGLLDLIKYWEDKSIANTVIAYALSDQEIWLDGQQVLVAKGEGIAFNLKVPHEVKARPAEHNWACLMVPAIPA
jgi:hypothetical protein